MNERYDAASAGPSEDPRFFEKSLNVATVRPCKQNSLFLSPPPPPMQIASRLFVFLITLMTRDHKF